MSSSWYGNVPWAAASDLRVRPRQKPGRDCSAFSFTVWFIVPSVCAANEFSKVVFMTFHSYSNKTQPAVLSSDLIRIPDKRRLVLSRVTCDCVTFTRTLQHMDMWTFVLIGLFFLFLFLNQLYFFFLSSSHWQNWNATQKDDKKPSVCHRMKIQWLITQLKWVFSAINHILNS